MQSFSLAVFAQSDEAGRIFAYQFEIGGKYRILQYRANVRNEPNRNGGVIAILSLNDEIEILENTWNRERINNVWGYWFKIKYGNIIGYTFGGNIAVKSLITDIDNNGIIDCFHFRYSNPFSVEYREFDSYIDVIIYINNQRINTNMLDSYFFNDFYPTLPYKTVRGASNEYDHYFEYCEFIQNDNNVLIELVRYGRDDYIWKTVYRIGSGGNIDFYEWRDEYLAYGENGFFIQVLHRVNSKGEWHSMMRDGSIVIRNVE
jgi:hypothetical protein